jgi:hypothetical protein
VGTAAASRPLGLTVPEPEDVSVPNQTALCGLEPVVSPDGRWLAHGHAFELHGTLFLRSVDGSVSEPILSLTDGAALVFLCGFSPDSATLLVYLGRRQEDPTPPLPTGVDAGFYLAHVADRRVLPLPDLGGFATWAPDSRHVLFTTPGIGTVELRQTDLFGSEATTVQRRPNNYFLNLTYPPHGDFILHRTMDRIMRSQVSGASRIELTPPGEIEEWASPLPSPDLKRVAYAHRTRTPTSRPWSIEVVASSGGPATVALHCKYECRSFGWETSQTLLVLDGDELDRVPLTGPSVHLAGEVSALLMPRP